MAMLSTLLALWANRGVDAVGAIKCESDHRRLVGEMVFSANERGAFPTMLSQIADPSSGVVGRNGKDFSSTGD